MSLHQLLNMRLDSSKLSPDELIDLQVIEEVQKHECLWNNEHADFGKKTNRETWDLVETATGIKVDDAKHRWKRMKDRLRCRLKSAMTKPKAENPEDLVPTTSLWPLFPAMTFIINGKLINRWVYSNCNEGIENDFNISDFQDNLPIEKDTVEVISDNESVNIDQNRTSRSSKRKRTADDSIETEEENLAEFQEKVESNIDADYLFLMSLLPSIKQFPDKTKMGLKIKIQKLIYDEISDFTE